MQLVTTTVITTVQEVDVLIMRHWSEGGTGVTNFDKPNLPIYLEAIRRYGDRNLIVVPAPFIPSHFATLPASETAYLKEKYFSLHRFHRVGDLGAFWRIFESVEHLDRIYQMFGLGRVGQPMYRIAGS